MLGFVQNWFAPPPSPIGVDFGTDCLRLAQVERGDGESRLVAAASLDVPPHVRNDIPARLTFFTEGLRDLLTQTQFRGRKAVLTLPASLMYIQHLRLPKMEDDALKKALPWELRGKLPIDPSHALLRHTVAGEVYQDQEPKTEVIVMAARRDFVDQLLAAASKARLDIVGMNTEPKAIIDCFSHVYRRKSDLEATACYLDMGCNSSRAVIARGTHIFFARAVPVGGEHFSRAVANGLKISLEEAKLLRARLAAQTPSQEAAEKATESRVEEGERRVEEEFAMLGAALAAAQKRDGVAPQATAAPAATVVPQSDQRTAVEQACREPLAKMVEELSLCRRYYESTFPNRPVDRLIFLGGEARHRWLCQSIARELGLPAQIGDPLARMPREYDGGPESGIDRKLPQPAWSVAVGLSMGPTGVEAIK
jgi:type IV pilus assembly protein PilM